MNDRDNKYNHILICSYPGNRAATHRTVDGGLGGPDAGRLGGPRGRRANFPRTRPGTNLQVHGLVLLHGRCLILYFFSLSLLPFHSTGSPYLFYKLFSLLFPGCFPLFPYYISFVSLLFPYGFPFPQCFSSYLFPFSPLFPIIFLLFLFCFCFVSYFFFLFFPIWFPFCFPLVSLWYPFSLLFPYYLSFSFCFPIILPLFPFPLVQ